jgi:hypothetical protein
MKRSKQPEPAFPGSEQAVGPLRGRRLGLRFLAAGFLRRSSRATRGSPVPDQGHLSGRNPSNKGRCLNSRLCLHKHVQRRGLLRAVGLPHLGFRPRVQGSTLAIIHPGHDYNYLSCENDDRVPLLFIAGSEDRLMPPSLQPVKREALQVEHADGGQGVPEPSARHAGLTRAEEAADHALDNQHAGTTR